MKQHILALRFEKRKQKQELAKAKEMGINLSGDEEDTSEEDEGQGLTQNIHVRGHCVVLRKKQKF